METRGIHRSSVWLGVIFLTVLTIGAVQALVGLLVYIERFTVHG